MKITNIRTIRLNRQLTRVLRNSCDSIHQRRFTFVIVETDAGITGLGDAPGNQNFIEAIIETHYKNKAVGMDPCDAEGLWKKLYTSGGFWEIGGSAVCALSAIEVACWDIRGNPSCSAGQSAIGSKPMPATSTGMNRSIWLTLPRVL
jgi:L-alanine-DL-glutamate epimerase-like enolase superfamily enzyme